MKIESDNGTGALYFELSEDADVDRTEQVRDGAFVDLDAGGRAIGAEFVSLEAFEDFAADLSDDPNFATNIGTWLRGQDDIRRLFEEAAAEARRRRVAP